MINNKGLKISIITACYNSEKYIEGCIKSVMNQSYENIEYIIIDGRSTDGTIGIVEKYKDKIDRIISEPDRGIYDAFNKGIKLSTGDVIYFLNSDDYLYDNSVIENIAQVFMNNRNVKIVYGNVMIKDDKCNYCNIVGGKIKFLDMTNGIMPLHPGIFVNRNLFEKHGLFNNAYKICADYDFIIKCFKTDEKNAVYINKIISVFREGGISSDPEKYKLKKKEVSYIHHKHFENQIVDFDTEITENDSLFRIWLDVILIRRHGISRVINDCTTKDVAIFGTKKTALYLLRDLKKEGFNVVAFLDNNINMHGKTIQNIKIVSPNWLKEYKNKIGTIIVSIENANDIEVINQLKLIVDDKINILSWKDLVRMNE